MANITITTVRTRT